MQVYRCRAQVKNIYMVLFFIFCSFSASIAQDLSTWSSISILADDESGYNDYTVFLQTQDNLSFTNQLLTESVHSDLINGVYVAKNGSLEEVLDPNIESESALIKECITKTYNKIYFQQDGFQSSIGNWILQNDIENWEYKDDDDRMINLMLPSAFVQNNTLHNWFYAHIWKNLDPIDKGMSKYEERKRIYKEVFLAMASPVYGNNEAFQKLNNDFDARYGNTFNSIIDAQFTALDQYGNLKIALENFLIAYSIDLQRMNASIKLISRVNKLKEKVNKVNTGPEIVGVLNWGFNRYKSAMRTYALYTYSQTVGLDRLQFFKKIFKSSEWNSSDPFYDPVILDAVYEAEAEYNAIIDDDTIWDEVLIDQLHDPSMWVDTFVTVAGFFKNSIAHVLSTSQHAVSASTVALPLFALSFSVNNYLYIQEQNDLLKHMTASATLFMVLNPFIKTNNIEYDDILSKQLHLFDIRKICAYYFYTNFGERLDGNFLQDVFNDLLTWITSGYGTLDSYQDHVLNQGYYVLNKYRVNHAPHWKAGPELAWLNSKIKVYVPEITDYEIANINIDPSYVEDGEQISIPTVIRNNGTEPGPADVPVTFYVDGSQSGSTLLPSLAPGAEQSVSFNWTAQQGVHTLRVEVELTGDENSQNDYHEITIQVDEPQPQGITLSFDTNPTVVGNTVKVTAQLDEAISDYPVYFNQSPVRGSFVFSNPVTTDDNGVAENHFLASAEGSVNIIAIDGNNSLLQTSKLLTINEPQLSVIIRHQRIGISGSNVEYLIDVEVYDSDGNQFNEDTIDYTFFTDFGHWSNGLQSINDQADQIHTFSQQFYASSDGQANITLTINDPSDYVKNYSFNVQYEIPELAPILTIPVSSSAQRVSFCPTDDKVAFTEYEDANNIKIYDISEQKIVEQFSFTDPESGQERKPTYARYSPDGEKIFIGSDWGSRIIDASTGQSLASNDNLDHFGNNSYPYRDGDVHYCNNGYILAAEHEDDYRVLVIDDDNLNIYRTLKTNQEFFSVYADGGYAILGPDDESKAYLYSTSSWNYIRTYTTSNYDGNIYSVAISPDGAKSAVYSTEGNAIFIYNNSTGSEILSYGVDQQVADFDWNPVKEKYLASLHLSGYGVVIWDANTGTQYCRAPDVSYRGEIDWSGDGEMFASIGSGSLKIFAPFDQESPTLVIDSPVDDFQTSSNSIELSGYATDDGSISKVQYSINSSDPVPVALQPNSTFSQSIPLQVGANTIVVEAFDAVGKKASCTIHGARLIEENNPPFIINMSPSSGQHSDPVHLEANYNDVDGDPITQIEYQYSLDGSNNWQQIVVDDTPSDGYDWVSGLNEQTVWLRAKAFDGQDWSVDWYKASGSFSIYASSKVATPTLTPQPPYTFTNSVNINMTCATEGASIHYTTDGTTPTESDPSGTSVTLTQTTTLKAKAFKEGMTASDVASGVYTLESSDNNPPTVTSITPASGQHSDPVHLDADYDDVDGDPITQIEYQYSLDGSSNWQSITIDDTPSDGYDWTSGLNEATVWLRAKAYDGQAWSISWTVSDASIYIDNSTPSTDFPVRGNFTALTQPNASYYPDADVITIKGDSLVQFDAQGNMSIITQFPDKYDRLEYIEAHNDRFLFARGMRAFSGRGLYSITADGTDAEITAGYSWDSPAGIRIAPSAFGDYGGTIFMGERGDANIINNDIGIYTISDQGAKTLFYDGSSASNKLYNIRNFDFSSSSFGDFSDCILAVDDNPDSYPDLDNHRILAIYPDKTSELFTDLYNLSTEDNANAVDFNPNDNHLYISIGTKIFKLDAQKNHSLVSEGYVKVTDINFGINGDLYIIDNESMLYKINGPDAPQILLGDVNDDQIFNSTDALIILSCDVGLDVSQFCPMNGGDVNGDGLVNSTDALIILSHDVGLQVPFDVGQPSTLQAVTPCAGCK